MDYRATVERFLALTSLTREVQEATLFAMLSRARESLFGKNFDFAKIRDVRDFRSAVPIATSYEEFRPWIERDATACTGEPPDGFLTTSGSTGKPKLLPYTKSFKESVRRAHDVFSSAVFRDSPAVPLTAGTSPRAIGLYQISRVTTPEGARVDSYASRLYDVALPEDPFFWAIARETCEISNAKERLYAMLLIGASWDVRALRATNPTTLLLFARVIAEQTEQLLRDLSTRNAELGARLEKLGRPLTPRDLWPRLELLITWRGGACALFEPALKKNFGEVRIRGPITAATEGVMAIPLEDDQLGGVLALESSYFEFRPVDEPQGDVVSAHEVEIGRSYELILTAPTGLYRYAIGDVFLVDGRIGTCPTVCFKGRKGRTSSLTGEKLTEIQVDEAFAKAARGIEFRVAHFLLSAQFDTLPWYVLSIEWELDVPPPNVGRELARRVDEVLQELNPEYRDKRKSSRLGEVALKEVAAGEFDRSYAAGISGGRAINYKLPHLSVEPIHNNLSAIVR